MACLKQKKEDTSMPILNINCYEWEDDISSDSENMVPVTVSECKQLLPTQKNSVSHQYSDMDMNSQLLTEEIDEPGLKMMCLDRIKMIQNDMTDPSLTPTEKMVNQTNLNVLNTILSNVKLSEKIKLGSLYNAQYTDAIILQKQLVCNLAGQRECSEVVKSVTMTQPTTSVDFTGQDTNNKRGTTPQVPELLIPCQAEEKQSKKNTSYDVDASSNARKHKKSILKAVKNNVNESVAAL